MTEWRISVNRYAPPTKRRCKNLCDSYPKFSWKNNITHQYCSYCMKAVERTKIVKINRCPCCLNVVRFRSTCANTITKREKRNIIGVT